MKKQISRKKIIGIGSAAAAFAILGLAMLFGSKAATYVVNIEAESGKVTGKAETKSGQSGASNQGMVAFGGGSTTTPPPNPPTGSVKYPADIVGKDDWKITIPESSDGKVVEIKPPAFAIYTSKYFFLNDTKDGAVFRAWHGGSTTSGSPNPRSELRERYNNDPEGYWDASKGTHTMELTGQVNRLTKVRPHVVIAQIHDKGDDTSVWRVEGKELWITKGDTAHGFLVDNNFQLNKKYTLKYVVTNGKYEYYYNGTKVNFTQSYPTLSYFKAGNYLQSNSSSAPGESTSEYSEVVIYSVKFSHK